MIRENIKHILKAVSASLFAGGFIYALGTAGLSDSGNITFEQVANRLLIALVVMVGSYAMLRCLDEENTKYSK